MIFFRSENNKKFSHKNHNIFLRSRKQLGCIFPKYRHRPERHRKSEVIPTFSLDDQFDESLVHCEILARSVFPLVNPAQRGFLVGPFVNSAQRESISIALNKSGPEMIYY